MISELYIITGSNGAGKSSVGSSYLPEHVRNIHPVFDGDKLFMQKQKELWLSGIRAHKEAKKIAYQFVSDTFDELSGNALKSNSTFAYEGHFTNDATWDTPKKFRAAGFRVNLIFFGVINPDVSELRVIDRVKEGGHFVPRHTVEDNFYGNLEKLNQYFGLIDDLLIVDTSETQHIVLAHIIDGKVSKSVAHRDLPDWFTKYLPILSEIIRNHQ